MTHPLLYEINARCWLRDLSRRLGRDIHLGNVPDDEFRLWQRLGFTHIWLMGVWKTGPRARRHALEDPDLRDTYQQVLPDWRESDVLGSPYAIADYRVPDLLGGEPALRCFRRRLRESGLRLVLDFVPNHLGRDHAWLSQRPELFVQSSSKAPGTFRPRSKEGAPWFAYGRDPYFPPWKDTVQLEYRRAETRAAMIEVLHDISRLCDGVRCDMAMLLLNDVFSVVWREFPCSEPSPIGEFWTVAIETIKRLAPDFLLLAEAYWGLERRLQELGFDYTYDKTFYDHLVARERPRLQRHLAEGSARFLAASIHFLENHDEPRVAALLSPEEQRAAALVTLGLPGMRLVHEGQMTGARLRTPVHLGRRFPEPTRPEILDCYEKILSALPLTAVGHGQAEILRTLPAWEGNPTDQDFVAVLWQRAPPRFDLVAVNLAPHPSQCYVALRVSQLSEFRWQMKDLLGAEIYERDGHDLAEKGLYLDLPARGAQLFQFQPIP